ncbi:MAG: AAA family ATPase [Chromatiales bacterium]|nr:AAA family ATPase [Chromatiales bacterium]
MIDVIASLKGGSGKSTVTFNLAVYLALAGESPILLDLDPQATLTDVVEVRREEGFEPAIEVLGPDALGRSLKKATVPVLIDIGASDIKSMHAALGLADRVIVPVPPSQADIWSTQRFLRIVAQYADQAKPPQMLGFINRADTHQAVRESDEAAAALVALPGIRFIKPRLAQRTAFRRSFSEGLAVFELEPRGKSARELMALAAALYPGVLG